jgi:hypothetical protein
MRLISVVLIGLVVVMCIVGLYALIAKPTVVLPTVTVPLTDNNALAAIARQQNISQFEVKARTDGKMFLTADGRDIGTVNYNPATLRNTVALASKVALPDNALTAIRILPVVFPGLALNAALTGLATFFVLPVELNLRFIPG